MSRIGCARLRNAEKRSVCTESFRINYGIQRFVVASNIYQCLIKITLRDFLPTREWLNARRAAFSLSITEPTRAHNPNGFLYPPCFERS